MNQSQPFVSKIKKTYQPKSKRGTKAYPVIIEAFEEERDGIIEDYDKLYPPEQQEQREYFNTVTTQDDLGDFIFDKENTWEDVEAKLDALDEEDKEKLASAIEETRLISILSTKESDNPEQE